MSPKRLSKFGAISKGIQLLVQSQVGYDLRRIGSNFLQNCSKTCDDTFLKDAQNNIQNISERVQTVIFGAQQWCKLWNQGYRPGECGKSEEQLDFVKENVNDEPATFSENSKSIIDKNRNETKLSYSEPEFPKNYTMDPNRQSLSTYSRERSVPSSRLGRMASFGNLVVGLSAGALLETTRRTLGLERKSSEKTIVDELVTTSSVFLTEKNVQRLVRTLCRVRGAALKLGQMLSIQDSTLLDPALLAILDRVRHSADFMPFKQVHKVLVQELGVDWRSKVVDFDERPFAAASIGQVHRAVLPGGQEVAMKVQYPGVAESIESDIDNLILVLKFGKLFPRGMFLEEFVKVAKRELRWECDYLREARAMRAFSQLVQDYRQFYVPKVYDQLSSRRVLTSELISGVPVDKCVDQPQLVRDHIATQFVELCLREIFQWRFMQTDPNWANFFFGQAPDTGAWRLVLLDFGSARTYDVKFVDQYMRLIKATYDGDEQQMIDRSLEIGFLTGYESSQMQRAHCETMSVLGETLSAKHPYNFAHQDVTKRVHRLIPVMLEHRLTPPPEQIYSLHRKLAGAYLLATKLAASVATGPLFERIHRHYQFDSPNQTTIDIDTD